MKIKKKKCRYLYTFDTYLYHYYIDRKTNFQTEIYHALYSSIYCIGYYYHDEQKGFWLKK